MLKYTLEDCHSDTSIRLKPYLAFRQRHALSKANEFADKKYKEAKNGVSFKLYQGYSRLYLQFSKPVDYVHVPDWYYNIEYIEEQRRGYEHQEDLLVPGYFEFPMKRGESIVLSAGLDEVSPSSIKRSFSTEVKNRIPRSSFENCLHNSAQQFIRKQDDKTWIVAGYPWFGTWGRDTFISLPGLASVIDPKNTSKIIDTSIKHLMQDGLFVNYHLGDKTNYTAADAPLWFVWAIQKAYPSEADKKQIKKTWYKAIKEVLTGYKNGQKYNIHMAENGLIWAGEHGKALTWMDAVVNGKPVTPRIGFTVEINALWFNAVSYALELAKHFNDKSFIAEWQDLPKQISTSFKDVFWEKDKGYLADYVNGDFKDWSIRPNMVIAASMPFSPISKKIQQLIVATATEHLLTERGLRSLSPRNPDYKGTCEGNQVERDLAYHQGSVWPWLFGHFAEAYLKIHDKAGVRKMEWYLERFEEAMTEHGIGTISEIYDGDPPHTGRGCISQAWSVAEVLRAKKMIDSYLNNK
jgi:predicted glycogen debranching enzyme